ncbi:MAG: ParA family protein [Candidatus Bathyarchaeota archaeon]|nr:ParA family protein [Candidatus Bathyarchaeota archaeon]
MTRCIAIHSSRGGTGKTVIASNIAGTLASRGKKVLLLDFDFRAPSLCTVFSKAISEPINCWLNDYFNGQCSDSDVPIDISAGFGLTPGCLYVGLANPSISAIKSMIDKSRSWEVNVVKKLFSLLSFCQKKGIDYCIIDNSPGVQYSSLNALAVADICLIITSADIVDLYGTSEMIKEVYEKIDRKAAIILNKFSPEGRNQNYVDITFVELTLGRKVICNIPCYCEVLQANRMGLLAIQLPEHPFVKKISEVIEKIDSMCQW